MVTSPPGAACLGRSLLVTVLHLHCLVRRLPLPPLVSSSLGAEVADVSLLFRRLRVQLRWRSYLPCFLRRMALVSLQPEAVAVAAVALLAVV